MIKVLNLQQMIFIYLFVYLCVFKRTPCLAEEGLRPQINVILIAQILALGIGGGTIFKGVGQILEVKMAHKRHRGCLRGDVPPSEVRVFF